MTVRFVIELIVGFLAVAVLVAREVSSRHAEKVRAKRANAIEIAAQALVDDARVRYKDALPDLYFALHAALRLTANGEPTRAGVRP